MMVVSLRSQVDTVSDLAPSGDHLWHLTLFDDWKGGLLKHSEIQCENSKDLATPITLRTQFSVLPSYEAIVMQTANRVDSVTVI